MKTEKIFSVIILLSSILLYFHLLGAATLFVLSLLALSLIYFVGGFYFFCDKVIKRQNIALSIISGITLSIIPIGIMFKGMRWEGGQMQLEIGVISGIAVVVATYFIKLKAKEELATYYKNMFLRSVILTVLSIIFYLIPA